MTIHVPAAMRGTVLGISILALLVLVAACATAAPTAAAGSNAASPSFVGTWTGEWTGSHMTTPLKVIVEKQEGASVSGTVVITYRGKDYAFTFSGSVTEKGRLYLEAEGRRVFDLALSGENTLEGQGQSPIHTGPVRLTRS